MSSEKILLPHYKKTLERIKQHKIVGFAQDSSDIDMGHMENVKDLGFLNDSTFVHLPCPHVAVHQR